jgi:eukaryotic-like serine/threonine-protein kinase
VSSGSRPRTLAGRYRLDEVIGRGGMSTVYRGTDLSLDRPVAVKVALDPMAEENPVYVARFKREARAAASINNPGVVTVYDAGADGPTRYIVMEFVEGKSLADLLREDKPLAPNRAADIAEQVAGTLAAAHAAGIVHRDIKPGNIMVEPGDRVKVLDFGIARTADAVTLTQTASVLGTAPYMAPEQAMGNPADARSDIYALGCVLYEMLTGQPPFMADLPAAVMHQHVRVAPKPPSQRNPAVPPALDALVMEMLAKRPEDRPQTAVEVRDRLAAYLRGGDEPPTAPTARIAPIEALAIAADVPQAATVPQPATVPPKATAATRALPPPPEPGRGRGAGVYLALAAIAVVLLGAAVAYAIARGGSSHSTSTSSHSASHATTPATSPPHTNSAPSSTASTTTTTTTITTTASTPTTSSTPTTTVPGPPGQGGPPPPGQAKKDKGKPK